MICPIGRDAAKPCPRKPCESCREDMAERSAILQFGEGTGNPSEMPTCATRAEADALARSQALAAMPGQGSLIR
jgi:hypothetical protein